MEIKKIEKDSATLNLLYTTYLGRLVLKILTLPLISWLVGLFMESPLSVVLIRNFIAKHRIDMKPYVDKNYRSFNDFFTRELKDEYRLNQYDQKALVAPCDGLLSVYKLDDKALFKIKNSCYSLEEMLADKEMAARFKGGYCLVFRLCVNHYHRYAYNEAGHLITKRKIKGILHTVRPIACHNQPIYHQNTREYMLLESNRLGSYIQMEVGAMLVGKIVNYPLESFEPLQQKGLFCFGGSTVVLIYPPDVIVLNDELLAVDYDSYEVEVRMGEKIGEVRDK